MEKRHLHLVQEDNSKDTPQDPVSDSNDELDSLLDSYSFGSDKLETCEMKKLFEEYYLSCIRSNEIMKKELETDNRRLMQKLFGSSIEIHQKRVAFSREKNIVEGIWQKNYLKDKLLLNSSIINCQ